MINNRIYRVSEFQAGDRIKNVSNFVVELDGEKIQSEADFIEQMEVGFKFPRPCNQSRNRYMDWMQDLDWLKQESFTLVINHYNNFLSKEPLLKKDLIDEFQNVILPFWEKDVINCVVDGKPKSFNVYLVDSL